jgi:hypothetical protein
MGEHEGICSISGQPDNPRADVRQLLSRLHKYRHAGKWRFRLKISKAEEEYLLEAHGLPTLRACIRLRKKGDSVGDLFAGSKKIGRAVIFAKDKKAARGGMNQRRS